MTFPALMTGRFYRCGGVLDVGPFRTQWFLSLPSSCTCTMLDGRRTMLLVGRLVRVPRRTVVVMTLTCAVFVLRATGVMHVAVRGTSLRRPGSMLLLPSNRMLLRLRSLNCNLALTRLCSRGSLLRIRWSVGT